MREGFQKMDFEKSVLLEKLPKTAKIAPKLTLEGLKYPPEVWVQHKTFSIPVLYAEHLSKRFLNQKKLAGLAGGFREGQNRSKYCPE